LIKKFSIPHDFTAKFLLSERIEKNTYNHQLMYMKWHQLFTFL